MLTFPPEPVQEEALVKRLRLMSAAVAGLALLGTGVAQAAGPYPPPSKGTGHVNPSRIKVGECTVFSGDGFAPLSSVAVSDNGSARGSARADSSGAFSIRLCYTTNDTRGRHDLAGSGTGSDLSPLTVTAVLIVEGVRQSPGNHSTVPGGQPATGPGSAGGTAGRSGSTGAAAAPGTVTPQGASGSSSAGSADDVVAGNPILPVGGSNSGLRLVLLVLTSLGFALATCFALLLLARRRPAREDDSSAALA